MYASPVAERRAGRGGDIAIVSLARFQKEHDVEDLAAYFESTKGTGVLATADSSGRVDTAIYARPHMTAEKEAAFIMADRLSHANVTENPNACYLFIEDGEGYRGKRLYLTRLREEKNTERINELRRRTPGTEPEGDRFLVFFSVDRVRPLIGG